MKSACLTLLLLAVSGAAAAEPAHEHAAHPHESLLAYAVMGEVDGAAQTWRPGDLGNRRLAW